jgi:hypothetical protein
MTLKVTCKARSAGGRSSSKCGERDEMDGQPERARMRDAVESMEPAEAVRHRQCEALGAAREPGGSSQSFHPADLMLYVIHV